MNTSRLIFALLATLIGWPMRNTLWAESPVAVSGAVAVVNLPAEDHPHLSVVDRRLMTCVILDIQSEIELAQWAAKHARDDSVRKFAAKVGNEWSAFLRTLDERTGGRSMVTLRNVAHETEQTPEEVAQALHPAKRSMLNMLNVERTLMRMKQEIVADSAESLRSQLESGSQDEIDSFWVGSEVFRQVQMQCTLKVLRKYSSATMGPIFDEAIKTSQRHLQEVVELGGRI
ncbi:MAG TPA: hypothetical protein VHV08_08975 [Pirellulales bacterium]|jgi:predicted outer membrane protein|nr:hypothetical protein [Pirellulales bacterium]